MLHLPMESVHPLVVHFPIALLLTAVALDLLAFLLKRDGLHRIALWNLSLGTVGAAVAVLTGLQAEDIAKHSFEIWQVIELHKRLGITTLILGLMTVAWRLRYRDQLSTRSRVVTIVAMLVIVCTVTYGAYLGGRLVYEFGVGGPFGASTQRSVPSHQH